MRRALLTVVFLLASMPALAQGIRVVPRPLNGSSTGATADATYITQVSESGLSAEQSLAALASGIVRVATTTGVLTSLTTSAGIAANLSDETGSSSGVLVFNNGPALTAPKIASTVVGSLGTCDAGATGTVKIVTDALVPVALATVAAGGAAVVPVYCNGTNWTVF